jgi:nucleotide-binding universal stress UspA family protein
MLSIQTILHPTDLSSSSVFAFQLACALARDYGARLIILHVVLPPSAVAYRDMIMRGEFDGSYQQLREELEKIQPPDPTIRVEHRLQEGDAASEILRMAQETHADLVVMGTHGRVGLGRLMGSVAEKVVRQAHCPVLTIRAALPSAPAALAAEGSGQGGHDPGARVSVADMDRQC